MTVRNVKFASVLSLLVLSCAIVDAYESDCRPRGCTGTVFKGMDSGFSLGSFSKASCGGDCDVFRSCRGAVTCKISKRTMVTWNQMLGLDIAPDEKKEDVNWISRSADEVAVIARWSLFSEKIIKIKAEAVGVCDCRCKKKYRAECSLKVVPRASNVVRKIVSETIHEDPNERRIRRMKAYNNL